MICRPLFLVLFFSASNVLSQQQVPTPAIENGYVTRTVSLSDFDVNGFHVVAGKDATSWGNHLGAPSHKVTVDPYFGQRVTVYGEFKKKKHEVIATEVTLLPLDAVPCSGFALVEHILSPTLPGSAPMRLLVRADGYIILI